MQQPSITDDVKEALRRNRESADRERQRIISTSPEFKRLEARIEQLEAENKKRKEALEEIRDLETECCHRCEGNGRLWADGKAHLPSYSGDTIPCGSCGGSGRILPEDAQDIAEQALKGE